MINNIGELKAALAAGDKIVVARWSNFSEADLRKADLRGANFSEANFSGANFSEANFSEADLRKADFSEANFSEANFSDANLSNADLREANFSDANLRVANLSGADLRKSDLRGANLRWANLTDANFSGADLRGATVGNHVVCVGEESIQLLLQFCRIVTADESALAMETVHTCDTAHCGAGWICTLSEQAKLLEGLIGWNAAACLTVPIPEFTGLFYATNQEMLDFAAETLDDNGASLRAKYLA
jgi:uncharacterized protein YjbI with pentapeptide repeats